MKRWVLAWILAILLQFSVVAIGIDLTAHGINQPHQGTYNTVPYTPTQLTAEAGGPYQNNTGRGVKFVGAAWPSSYGGYLVLYRWDFGDGSDPYIGYFTDTSQFAPANYGSGAYLCPAYHEYENDGYYIANLTVYDSRGNSASDSALVAINRPLQDVDYPSWPSDWWTAPESHENEFSKKVRDPSTNEWVESAEYRLNDRIYFKIELNIPEGRSGVEDIRIVDFLPPTVEYVGASLTPTSITTEVYFDGRSISFYPFTVLTWDIGDGIPGTTISIIIEGKVKKLDHEYFNISDYDFIPISYITTNTVISTYKYISYSPGCGNPYKKIVTLKNTASFRIVSGEPDIGIEKKARIYTSGEWQDDWIDAMVGDTLEFKLVINNTGDVCIDEPIYVRDLLPDELEYIEGSSNYNHICGDAIITPPRPKEPSIDGNLLEWVFDEPLDVGESIVITFRALVEKAGKYINVGSVEGSYNSIPLYDEDDITINASKPSEARINVEKKVWDGKDWVEYFSTVVGSKIIFMINVSNEGNVPLTDIIINDTLPDFLSFDDAKPLPDAVDDHNLTWRIPRLGIDEYLQIIVNVTATDTGEGYNKVEARSKEGAGDEDDAHVSVSSVGLVLTKEISVDNETWFDNVEVYTGQKVYYRINVTNIGSTELKDVTVKDDVKKLSFLSFNKSSPESSYVDDEFIYWNISALLPGESYWIYYTVDTISYGCGYNTACAESEEGASDCDYAFVHVIPLPITSVDVKKYVSVDGINWYKSVEIEEGNIVSFKILVKNNGTTKLDVVTINDTIPDYLEFVEGSFIPANAQVDGNNVTWVLEDISPGEIAEILFNATAVSCGAGYNFVEVFAENSSGTSYDNDTAGINVTCRSDVSIDKKVWDEDSQQWVDSISISETPKELRFNITVENTGTCKIYDLTIKDKLGCALLRPRDFYESESDLERFVNYTCGMIIWKLSSRAFLPGEKIYIEFNANASLPPNGGSTYNRADAMGRTCMGDFELSDTVNITYLPEEPEEPELAFSPHYINITREVVVGDVILTNFTVWNNGTGTLQYEIVPRVSWISVYPEDGESTGEKDVIEVEIDTSSLEPGSYKAYIDIHSNGGNGTVEINFEVVQPAPSPPTIEITKPRCGKIYLWNKEIFPFPWGTIVIGPISIEANASDKDGSIERVEFFVNNVSVFNDTEAPYRYTINEQMFGFCTVKVIAYDDSGMKAEDSTRFFMINFGIVKLD